MIVVPDYRDQRIEVNAIAVDGRFNAEVRIRGHAVNAKPHVEIVTCQADRRARGAGRRDLGAAMDRYEGGCVMVEEEFGKKLLERLARIEIAIQSINPDPEQTIQAHREQRDAQQRAADQLVVATQALVAMTRRLAIATWALVGVTVILAVAALAPFFLPGGD
jgi:hypothetical protein